MDKIRNLLKLGTEHNKTYYYVIPKVNRAINKLARQLLKWIIICKNNPKKQYYLIVIQVTRN
jgi:hypothetical protein